MCVYVYTHTHTYTHIVFYNCIKISHYTPLGCPLVVNRQIERELYYNFIFLFFLINSPIDPSYYITSRMQAIEKSPRCIHLQIYLTAK